MRLPITMCALTLGVSGCAGAAETAWLDRPWIDSGCDASGVCRLRGELTVTADGGTMLVLDDGQRVRAIVPSEILQHRERWNGRRVGALGRLDGEGTLSIIRLSLKAS